MTWGGPHRPAPRRHDSNFAWELLRSRSRARCVTAAPSIAASLILMIYLLDKQLKLKRNEVVITFKFGEVR